MGTRAEDELRRVVELLTEIEAEALRLVEGDRGASALSIVGRAASARRQLDGLLGYEPVRDPVAVSVAGVYVRRIRLGVTELKLSAGAAANLVGLTEEEVRALMRGEAGDLPPDLLERVAERLEAEQQLALDAMVPPKSPKDGADARVAGTQPIAR